jgi:hypothetical protein
MSLYLSFENLDVQFMRNVQLADVVQAFDLPIVEERHLQPGLSMTVPSTLRSLAENIVKVR